MGDRGGRGGRGYGGGGGYGGGRGEGGERQDMHHCNWNLRAQRRTCCYRGPIGLSQAFLRLMEFKAVSRLTSVSTQHANFLTPGHHLRPLGHCHICLFAINAMYNL